MIWFKNHYGYFLLTILAFVSWSLVNLTDTADLNNRLLPPHSPDFFSIGYTKWQMDSSGIANTEVFADKIVHFSDDRTTQMNKPRLLFHQEQNPPWEIYSESGNVSADGKNLQLLGKTIIERQAQNTLQALKITTSNLNVQPDIYYAETSEWAELLSKPNKTTGTGMKLRFKEPIHIELMAHVQGKYELQP